MTVKLMYVVFDVVAGESGPVFEANNDGTAMRQYQHMMAKEGVQEGDYELWCVGSLNHVDSGVDVAHAPRRVVGSLERSVDSEEGIG